MGPTVALLTRLLSLVLAVALLSNALVLLCCAYSAELRERRRPGFMDTFLASNVMLSVVTLSANQQLVVGFSLSFARPISPAHRPPAAGLRVGTASGLRARLLLAPSRPARFTTCRLSPSARVNGRTPHGRLQSAEAHYTPPHSTLAHPGHTRQELGCCLLTCTSDGLDRPPSPGAPREWAGTSLRLSHLPHITCPRGSHALGFSSRSSRVYRQAGGACALCGRQHALGRPQQKLAFSRAATDPLVHSLLRQEFLSRPGPFETPLLKRDLHPASTHNHSQDTE
ncbi:G-protein coupled receptor 78 [Loxodonta africana]|uniref:G-protein coupled receptor 78 n=1 Tax=Loxodonta africana TaxID=9785 RepID=UPI0030D03F45